MYKYDLEIFLIWETGLWSQLLIIKKGKYIYQNPKMADACDISILKEKEIQIEVAMSQWIYKF